MSWEWATKARKGRARLDYTQNASIKTLVAPYAVRPARGAPVSAPITWDELDDPDLRPDRWTVRTIVERVERGRRPVRGRPDRRPGTPRRMTIAYAWRGPFENAELERLHAEGFGTRRPR